MVMLGALSTFLDIDTETWDENLRLRLPARFAESSIKAFSLGATEIESMKLTGAAKSD